MKGKSSLRRKVTGLGERLKERSLHLAGGAVRSLPGPGGGPGRGGAGRYWGLGAGAGLRAVSGPTRTPRSCPGRERMVGSGISCVHLKSSPLFSAAGNTPMISGGEGGREGVEPSQSSGGHRVLWDALCPRGWSCVGDQPQPSCLLSCIQVQALLLPMLLGRCQHREVAVTFPYCPMGLSQWGHTAAPPAPGTLATQPKLSHAPRSPPDLSQSCIDHDPSEPPGVPRG